MANCHDAMEAWEWESVFSLPDPSDTTWHNDRSLPAAIDCTFASALLNSSAGSEPLAQPRSSVSDDGPLAGIALDGSRISSERDPQTRLAADHIASERSSENSSGVSKGNRRDPRLDCPNFRAGRIPCSCPELDEIEDGKMEDIGKRRPKTAARCQVPSCRSDISQLKGYHQRHRVCLGCANSPKVILHDQPHRYCQQCGKFHRLLHFDEDKRSCRRKLERHNRRRRRRPVEVVADAEGEAIEKDYLDVGTNMAAVPSHGEGRPSSPVPLNDSAEKPSTEVGELHNGNGTSKEQSFFEMNRSETSCEEAAQNAEMCELRHAPAEREGTDAPFTTVEIHNSSSYQQALEGHVDGSEKGSLHIVSDTPELGEFSAGDTPKEIGSSVMEVQHASDASSSIALRLGQEILSSNKSGLDEQSWLAMLMDDTAEGIGISASLRNARPSKLEPLRSSVLSGAHRRSSGYISPCPTGRVSFKLYDWNPADFPRRLRQQIFEWLANMPVELEGYIRSGCIILTFFITMPQALWDEMMNNWIGHVQNFVLGSGRELLSTGHIIARLNDKSVYMKDGKVLSADFKEQLAPALLDVHPRALEAGCTTDIYIFGFNLQRTSPRFLVSFGEQYLECCGCEPVKSCDFLLHRISGINEDRVEIWKVTVFLPERKKFGPAYVEVDNDHGVSNVIPILVTDKSVCTEINPFNLSSDSRIVVHDGQGSLLSSCKAYCLEQKCFAEILVDLGWVFRYMEEHRYINSVAVRDALKKRVERLLLFSVEHNWYVVTKRLIYTAVATAFVTEMALGSDEPRNYMLNLGITQGLRGLNNILSAEVISSFEGLLHEVKEEQASSSVPDITLFTDGTNYAFKSQYQSKELQGTSCKRAANESKLCYYFPSMEPQCSKSGNMESTLVHEHTIPLLETRVCIKDDVSQEAKHPWIQPLIWSRSRTRKIGGVHPYNSSRRSCRIIVTALSVVTVCVGMCLMLQHPHQVAEISMSLRRCLFGSNDAIPLV